MSINVHEATRACRYSAEAYAKDSRWQMLEKGTARCLLIDNGTVVWIAVQGTVPKWRDWFLNLWTVQTDWYGLSVHSGCDSEARRLLPLILDELEIRKNRKEPIKIKMTGHSQGGGVVALLAWGLEMNGYHVRHVYGFAPMRSVLKKSIDVFKNEFHGRLTGIINKSDIVPHLPPALRYGDPWDMYCFDRCENLTRGMPSPLCYCVDVAAMAIRGKLPYTVSTHLMPVYLERMENLSIRGIDKDC